MGHTVVSGLAYGVDQAAHHGALLAGGPTIAVMPCGVDRALPARARPAARRDRRPRPDRRRDATGNRAHPRPVPRPNRIVASLTEGTVVVEGAIRSGALTTARWAEALHRPVMGVPGPVASAASVGVNQLIRLGQASMVTTAQEVITDLTIHAYSAARDQIDESFVPGPVRSPQGQAPSSIPPASAPRRLAQPRPCG